MNFKFEFKKYLIPLLGILLFYFIVNILGSNTRCFFRNIYGIPCPGCGLSRAYTALFNGNITKAFFYHPLFPIPALIVLILILHKVKFIKNIYKSNVFWIIIFVLFISVYIIRMILFFPHTEPMTFYKNAIIPRIIKIFTHSF